MENYDHNTLYSLPIKPSPNLPNINAIYLYPALCLFEGTCISVGRGTDAPFQMFGHPKMQNTTYEFIPRSISGAAKNPPYLGEKCFGYLLSTAETPYFNTDKKLELRWLLQAYKNFPEKETFFNNYFKNLAGNTELQKQITEGKEEEEIRKSWEPALSEYKKIRKKYLLYADF